MTFVACMVVNLRGGVDRRPETLGPMKGGEIRRNAELDLLKRGVSLEMKTSERDEVNSDKESRKNGSTTLEEGRG